VNKGAINSRGLKIGWGLEIPNAAKMTRSFTFKTHKAVAATKVE
jgi:hypothetical protein